VDATSDPRDWNWRRTAFHVTWVTLAILVLGGILGPSGRVGGVEFSPDTFEHRSFQYVQWCGIQLTPTRHSLWQSDVDRYLHEQGFVEWPDDIEPRWYFVKGFAPHVRGWSGEAKSMCHGLGCYSGNDQWVTWSQENPELARVVWPRVVTLARNEQFATVLLLFKLTDLEQARSVADVEQKIARAEEMASE
jgi:hypothetical protein